ncbi:hypothetical protein BPIT_28860 [Candidatus Brocadia pituitae]|nr:hypothetical protein BPIT_28860 [Candidatus Brocadia pituitae]
MPRVPNAPKKDGISIINAYTPLSVGPKYLANIIEVANPITNTIVWVRNVNAPLFLSPVTVFLF